MKTKLTLLLALAVSTSAHAEKPNFNVARPSASIPAHSRAPAPSATPPKPSTSGGSSKSVSVRQMISIARSVLPHVVQSIQAPHPTRSNFDKTPAVPAKFRQNAPSSRVAASKPKTEIKKPLSASVLTNSAAMHEGRDIADGLQSLESLRDSALNNAAADLGLPQGAPDSSARDEAMRRQFENSPLAGFHPGANSDEEWNPSSILPNGGRNKTNDAFGASGSLSMPSFGSIRSGLASDGPATGGPGDHHEQVVTSGAEGTRSSTRETSADGTTVTAKTVLSRPDGTREIFTEQRQDKDGDGEAETIIGRRIEYRRTDGTGSSQETVRNPDGTYTTTESSSIPGSYVDSRRSTTGSAPAAMTLPHIRTGCVDPDATPRGGKQFTSPGHKGQDPAIMRARNRPGNQVRPDENSNTPAGNPRIISQGSGTVVNPGPVDMTHGSGGSAMNGARLLDGGKLVNPSRDHK